MYKSKYCRIKSSRTRIYLAYLGAIGMVLLGCGISDQLVALIQTPTATPLAIIDDCTKATNPTEQDVKYALGFVGNTFDPGSWDRSYTVESMHVAVTWKTKDRRRVAFLDYLIYSCGFKQSDWEYVLSDKTFREVRLRNFQNPNRIASCTRSENNLSLLEYAFQDDGTNYRIRFWATLNGPTRLLTMSLDSPEESITDLDRYSLRLFPALASCPG